MRPFYGLGAAAAPVLGLLLSLAPLSAAHANVMELAGHYVGSFDDVTIGNQGTIEVDLSFTGSKASFAATLGGTLFGGITPLPPVAIDGDVVGDDIVLDQTGVFLGEADLTGTIIGSTGAISILLTNFDPVATGIDHIDATGSFANGSLHVDFTVLLAPEAMAPFPTVVGTVDAQRVVPEPAPALLMAVGFVALAACRVRRRA